MAQFQILDHLKILEKYGDVTEYPSWVLATCPVCGGKLKISKSPTKYGSYACYTNECHKTQNNLIRKKLYKYVTFKKSTVFSKPVKTYSKLSRIIKELPLKININSFSNENKINFISPTQKIVDKKAYTYFDYDEFRMVRIDEPEKTKIFYPEIKTKSGLWQQGLPDSFNLIPIYRSIYFNENIIIVEGEKTATIGQLLGFNCITFPNFSWSESVIRQYLLSLKTKGLNNKILRNILYLQDNDATGDFKARLVMYTAWDLEIPCNCINIGQKLGVDKSGYDLYDAYIDRYITRKNAVEFLEALNDNTNN